MAAQQWQLGMVCRSLCVSVVNIYSEMSLYVLLMSLCVKLYIYVYRHAHTHSHTHTPIPCLSLASSRPSHGTVDNPRLDVLKVNLSEIARNSVRQSGFDMASKRSWLGEDFTLENTKGNDVCRSNVPDIRLSFRSVAGQSGDVHTHSHTNSHRLLNELTPVARRVEAMKNERKFLSANARPRMHRS